MKASTEFKKEHKPDFGKEKIEILYEDPYLMIIYKPEGLLSVPYPGSHSKTAIDKIEEIMRKSGTYSKNHRPFVVHRLDRETSGILMFAMTEASQKKIMDNWQSLVKERLYRAVAENPKNQPELCDFGIIDDNLAYNAHNVGFVPKENSHPQNTEKNRKTGSDKTCKSSIYEKNLTIKNGKPEFKTITARTHYRIVERGKTHTLFELSLDTGRKNQIRAHLASKGYILAGDENYRAHTDPFFRLALHAKTLKFTHPFTGEIMKFERTEPEEWEDFVKNNKTACPKPIWFQKENKKLNQEKINPLELKLARGKKLNKMDFIQRGKNR